MAKGKYRTRKDNRDATQLAADLARARIELAEELSRLDAVKNRADHDKQLREELDAAIRLRDRACAPQLAQIAADRTAIQKATRELAAATKSLDRHKERIDLWGLKELGAEAFIAILTGDRAVVRMGVASGAASNRAAEVIQRARGLRKHAPLEFSREQNLTLAQIAAASTGMPLPPDYDEDNEDSWTAFSNQVDADEAAMIAFRLPLPWLDITPMPEHTASCALGANPTPSHSAIAPPSTIPTITELSTGTAAMRDALTANGPTAVAHAWNLKLQEGLYLAANPTPSHSAIAPPSTIPTITELSTGTAAMRDALTANGPTAVAHAWNLKLQEGLYLAANSQIPTMISSSPTYPAPADAEALHAWYAAAAMGTWGRHRNSVNGRIAAATAAATPFWLPAGHTLAYLDSEPLSTEDIEELRLPYPQVLVTFAEPARLPAIDTAALPDDDPRLTWIDYTVATSDGHPEPRSLIIAGTNNFTEPLPALWDVIAARGAHIEAVLLLADAQGRMEDLFAWCIAIPSTTAGGAVGRWVIPASRASTLYANLVVNAAAVAAWADWHRPGHSRDTNPETQNLDGNAAKPKRNQPEDHVHVLNVTATSTPDQTPTATAEPTGRTTAPHRRRGHWRRQHYGPGRTNTRRIRIAPVMVNAGRFGGDRTQIYRLPLPDAEHLMPRQRSSS
ncbi:hypothetical protein [Mycobacteroides abscessus]|uniref:hypothetical protein n=1 Tax=Mycobacteroides abscessus TaxID=36809 RepID=UPI000927CCA5|nr:hypothetical protein [Mycobacteroides abscessus]SHQ48665.1 Uncharacterised protein [Mycobacteroides abscessus subsp. abscessus]SKQ85240.1 Uncharacterised protein [Mycobacteroides abscessus subsp. massiliense]SLC49154.1 Uncharacterised protein [Mycobacteroides abscessus subsp. massiliense]